MIDLGTGNNNKMCVVLLPSAAAYSGNAQDDVDQKLANDG